MNDTQLLLTVFLGIGILLYLVIHSKLHAFVSLLLVSLFIGLCSGMQPQDVLEAMQLGMGKTLGFVAVVVGLGAMFGRMLEVSGGAESLALRLLRAFGEERSQWALALTGFIVSIPVFFDVGFIILVPLLYGLSRKTGRSLMFFSMPLMAGMVVTHAFIPPTPGPIAVASLLGADLGWVILFGIITGLPCAIISGPIFGSWIAKRVPAEIPDYMDFSTASKPEKELPSFGTVFFLIFLPIFLILANTVSGVTLPEGNTLRTILTFVGHPFSALLLTTVACFFVLGRLRGFTRDEIQGIATKALEPAGIIILVTGAGGVLKEILITSGVGEVVKNHLADASIPLVLLGFLVSAAVRVMQGSATVAMIAGAGLLAPMVRGADVSQPLLALLVLSTAAGATFLSHVNDSGFWLVNRYLGMSVPDTLKSWSVMTMLIGIVGVLLLLLLNLFVP
jgi:Gnt-I system low-affinity gluconate transporter